MSSTVDSQPALARQPAPTPPAERASIIPGIAGVAICLLAAVTQVAWAGYHLGVGNQAIQIAFLKHWANPSLFTTDDMVRQTLPLYPSYFFRLLAPLLAFASVQTLYFSLHVLTTFLTLLAVYFLGRSIFRSHASALAAVGLMLAGHHQALAGDTLYSPGFTHTYVALPIALLALLLAYRRRMVAAFLVAGLLFNLHALTGAYAMLMLGSALLVDLRDMPFRRWLRRTALCALAAILPAIPTLLQMAAQHQTFDAGWLALMRIRSADHSFPSTWWAVGNPDLPRAALLFALFALSWSFPPLRRHDSKRALRVSISMALAVLALFAVGCIFTEIKPVPLIIRLQPFRASRLLFVLMFVHIAHAAVASFRAAWRGNSVLTDGTLLTLSRPARALECFTGILVLATLALPTFLPLLPWALLLVALAAFVTGRLSWVQSLIVAGALLVTLLAFLQIQFAIPFLSSHVVLLPHDWSRDPLLWLPLATAAIAALAIALARDRSVQHVVIAATLILGALFTGLLFGRQFNRPAVSPLTPVAQWAAAKTPTDALFLTPTGFSSFRILADRSLVGDWRDGTQLYFSGNYAADWFKRVSDLEPGLTLSPDGSRLLTRGRSLDTLDTASLLALAKKYHADYILLPAATAGHDRQLQVAYSDSHYIVYAPASTAVAATLPAGVVNPTDWLAMRKFMDTTVQQNIEKYRKADLSIQIVDPVGRPVRDLPVLLNETASAFHFGCSLGFFEPNDIRPWGDQKANVVTPTELKLFPEVFNSSMIPFSSKWLYLEPKPGEKHYSDLDKYVDYCTQHHITIEYHFLAGLAPNWMARDRAQQAKRFPDHAMEVVARYADRIPYWQVTNEGNLMRETPPVFKALREKYPQLKLGIADCVKFGSTDANPASRKADMYRGFQSVEWLQNQGVKLDFFGIHGHRPYGLWADPRTMYEVLDTVAARHVKIHVTEMLLPLGGPILGNVRHGKWTPDLESDFLADYLTVCFSHPDVELVNFWGLTSKSWGDSAGLLDDKENPRPAFNRLKQLITHTWHTHVETTLPLDGTLKIRAFQGTYELTLTSTSGQKVTTVLMVPEEPTATFHFRYDAERNTLVPLKEG